MMSSLSWEHKVVEWREVHEFLMDLLTACDSDDKDMRKICMALSAVDEKLEYWKRACQPDLFDQYVLNGWGPATSGRFNDFGGLNPNVDRDSVCSVGLCNPNGFLSMDHISSIVCEPPSTASFPRAAAPLASVYVVDANASICARIASRWFLSSAMNELLFNAIP